MNKTFFEDNWKQIRNRSGEWWSLLSEYDLLKVDKMEVKFDKYATLLRVKYGYTSEQAKKEISVRMAQIEIEPVSAVIPANPGVKTRKRTKKAIL